MIAFVHAHAVALHEQIAKCALRTRLANAASNNNEFDFGVIRKIVNDVSLHFLQDIFFEKIYRIIGREYPEAHLEVFLVLDSTTGQNALAQAKEFKEMADITGIVLTKLDGTSKGGIAVAIAADLALPVKYIGVGEGIEDLRPFDADSFIEALFEE